MLSSVAEPRVVGLAPPKTDQTNAVRGGKVCTYVGGSAAYKG